MCPVEYGLGKKFNETVSRKRRTDRTQSSKLTNSSSTLRYTKMRLTTSQSPRVRSEGNLSDAVEVYGSNDDFQKAMRSWILITTCVTTILRNNPQPVVL